MILEARNKTPFISFGFNRVVKDVYVDEPVDVYLHTLYNDIEFDVKTYLSTGGVFVEINKYHKTVTYGSVGSYEIIVKVISKDKSKTLDSNILNINVYSDSFDSDTVSFDNTTLTFDKE